MICNWVEAPCKCGFMFDGDPDEFEAYEPAICKNLISESIATIKVPRCKTCGTISILERIEAEAELERESE